MIGSPVIEGIGTMEIEGQVRIPSGCAIAAVISKEGRRMPGSIVSEAMRPMHERSNGLAHERTRRSRRSPLSDRTPLRPRDSPAASVVAAPFWSTIESKTEHREKHIYLRRMFPSLLITGPFSIVLGFTGGLMYAPPPASSSGLRPLRWR